MTRNQKFSAFGAIGGYFFLAALLLNVSTILHTSSTSMAAFLTICLAAGFTIFPWLAARTVVGRLPSPSLKELALIVFSLSSGGLALAILTAIFGNVPGFVCYVIQGLHLLILLLAGAAFLKTSAASNGGSTLLRWCGVFYFINGWFMPPFSSSLQCMESCTATGWKIFGIGLFELNIIVSTFMGFFVMRAVSLALKSGITPSPNP